MFGKFWQSYVPWHLEFLHILACFLNSSYIYLCMDLNEHHRGGGAHVLKTFSSFQKVVVVEYIKYYNVIPALKLKELFYFECFWLCLKMPLSWRFSHSDIILRLVVLARTICSWSSKAYHMCLSKDTGVYSYSWSFHRQALKHRSKPHTCHM